MKFKAGEALMRKNSDFSFNLSQVKKINMLVF